MNEIEALRAVDLDWAVQLSEVWEDTAWDVPELHAEIREEFCRKLKAMQSDRSGRSPLGWVIVGGGGTGKTHLLGSFRREAARQKAAFVLVDMTDVRDFWETVLQGYIGSLQQSVIGETFQYECLLRNIIEQLGSKQPVAQILSLLAERKSTDLAGDMKKVIHALVRVHRKEALKHHNVVRALICLNSDDPSIANLGMTWLQGQSLEDADRVKFGFTKAQEQPRRIIEALSWFMSLSGPTILAFDQLDPIVTQMHYRKLGEASSEEQAVAESIIVQIGGGLGAIRDTTRSTLTVVSCVETTWDILRGSALQTYIDRFVPQEPLKSLATGEAARSIIQGRLAQAYARFGFEPEYPSWPFRTEAFENLKLDTPRELLKRCDLHRRRCIREGVVSELKAFPPPGENGKGPNAGGKGKFAELDQRLSRLMSESNPAYLTEEKQEDQRLAPLFLTALQCLLHETRLPDCVRGQVDTEFTGGKTTRPLHARLRLIFEAENEREEHFCVRALEHAHPKAYQSRLKAAMTQAGIDRSLKFRHLAVVRTRLTPGGAETQRLTQKFTDAGGHFLKPTDDELRTIDAVHRLKQAGEPDFEEWLSVRRPISRLSLMQNIVPSPLFFNQNSTDDPVGSKGPGVVAVKGDPPSEESRTDDAGSASEQDPSPSTREAPFPLGRALVAGRIGSTVTMPLGLLEKHTLVLAGAGSGKTVLLRRLIEEAALHNVPSIVIDVANDLATLDDAWPEPPDSWLPEDVEKANRYHLNREVILWTPGRENGNPIALEPLPDLAAFAHDEQELEDAIVMVRESLAPIVASGQSASSRNKLGLLSKALRFFAQHGGGRLEDYVAILADLPHEAGLGLDNEARLARQMADALRVAIETNPLLRSAGTSLDPAVLFGDTGSPATRISLINFVGLPSLEAQRAFLNQLAMILFGWIKRHPEPGPRPLRGLLVIDEARDYVPSAKASTCKESLSRLAAQARKYHLGLVFATQNPKDIDNKIVANCSTHYYGKVNSPAAIEVVKELIRSKGGSGEDVPRLPRGQFYVHNADAGLPSPAKVQVPLCLSRHPNNPLDEAAILERAIVSRERI